MRSHMTAFSKCSAAILGWTVLGELPDLDHRMALSVRDTVNSIEGTSSLIQYVSIDEWGSMYREMTMEPVTLHEQRFQDTLLLCKNLRIPNKPIENKVLRWATFGGVYYGEAVE